LLPHGDLMGYWVFNRFYYAPNNAKLQNAPPPGGAHPGHLTVHFAWEGGNLNVALQGWGIWTRFTSFSDVILSWFVFRFLQGLVNLQDRISPLLVNNSFKRVFKRSLKVSSWHILALKSVNSVWLKTKYVLRRGISILIGGAFERFFYPEAQEGIWTIQPSKVQMPGGCSWGMLKFRIDWGINSKRLLDIKSSLTSSLLHGDKISITY